jgi:hypothetical protein
MFIQFTPWLPLLFLAVGIYMLIKSRGLGLKVIGALFVLIGAAFMTLMIWVYANHYRS